MSWEWWDLAPLAWVPAWLYCHRWYKRIWHHSLRWWALPFVHGSLLFVRRLERWERP